MLRRNRFGFRMRRRSLTGRLFQFLVILTVVSLFIYLLLYSANFRKDYNGPDFQWLKTRNVSISFSIYFLIFLLLFLQIVHFNLTEAGLVLWVDC